MTSRGLENIGEAKIKASRIVRPVDYVNAGSGEECRGKICPSERLGQAQTGRYCSDNWYQRIVYGYFPDRITAYKFVVERESYGGNAYKQT